MQNESDGKLIIKIIQDFDIVYKLKMQSLEREVSKRLQSLFDSRMKRANQMVNRCAHNIKGLRSQVQLERDAVETKEAQLQALKSDLVF